MGTGSPSRIQRPHTVWMQAMRYSVSVPRGAMFGPVPAVTDPRRPAANMRAAATTSAAGTLARRST